MQDAMALAREIAGSLRALPDLVAIALSGSQAGGADDEWSDLDLVVYASAPVPPDVRIAGLSAVATDVANVDFWGPATVGRSHMADVPIDVTFFDVTWMESHLRSVLEDHRAQLGYTTAFVYTVHHGSIVHDPSGWLARMQAKTATYPDQLALNIIDFNWPVLRDTPHSYREQLIAAVRRGDLVSVNHRVAQLLSSYFDVLFAFNRVFHPGEKRLLARARHLCPALPENFEAQVAAVALAHEDVVSRVDAILDSAERILRSSSLP